jgi:hypothetical protein
MIREEDCGYTLRCTGCGASLTRTYNELRDPDRALDIKSSFGFVHRLCDGFGDVKQARAFIKAKRGVARKAARAKR